MAVELSIVIVTYNVQNYIKACLDSVMDATKDLGIELLIVDNSSTDDTVRLIQRSYPSTKLLMNKENLGLLAANNQALTHVQGKFVLYLNADTVLKKDAIRNALEFMKQHEQAGIVGAKLLSPDRVIQRSCSSFPSLWGYFLESTFLYLVFGKSQLRKNGIPIHYNYQQPRAVDVVAGAFFLVRRDVVNDIGGFDDSFFMYSDEDDYCYRAMKKGWLTYIVPQAEVIHFEGGSFKTTRNYMFMLQHRSKIRCYRKSHGRLATLGVAVILFTGVVLRILLWLCMSAWTTLLQKQRQQYVLSKLGNYLHVCGWYLRTGFKLALI